MKTIRALCAAALLVASVTLSGCNSIREGWGSPRLPEQWEPDVSESPQRD